MKLIKSYGTVLLLLLAGLFSGTQVSEAQIYSNTASAAKQIKYKSYDGEDKLFVFYQTNGSYHSGSLSVNSPAGSADFVWTQYDPGADAFSIPVSTDAGQTSSTISNLDEGGYQVHISDGVDLDTSFIGWLMLDNLFVSTVKDNEGMVFDYNSGCANGNYLVLDAVAEADSFFYFDPVTHESIRLINDYNFEWTSDNSDIVIYNARRYLYLDKQVDPVPYEDTYFILTATDSLGMVEVDSVFYDTKFTKAEFTLEYYDKINEAFETDLTIQFDQDKGSLDAPLTVRFINESENGADYTWVFLDTLNVIQQEGTKIYLDTADFDYQPEFTYYNADKFYYPYLVSISDANCVDTFSLEDGVRVVPSDLVVPNAFSPNGDGINDEFIFKHQSLKEFKLTIINKHGMVVYRQKIDDIYLWEGWLGTILNTDRPAPEGQYYYIVEALGWDNVEYKDPNVFERWQLDRQQGGTTNPGTSTPSTGGTDPETTTTTLFTGWLYLFREYLGSY